MRPIAYTGFARALLLLVFLAGLFPLEALAATIRWEILPDRDRVIVSLTKEEGFAGRVTRVSPTGLLLDLGVPTAGMKQELAPENARFFTMSEPRGRAIGFFMKTAAFGYVVTRPDRHTVVINAFADPLGERWGESSAAKAEPAPRTGGNAAPVQNTAQAQNAAPPQGTQPLASSGAALASPPQAAPGPDMSGPTASGLDVPGKATPVPSSAAVPPASPQPASVPSAPQSPFAIPTGTPGVVRGRITSGLPAAGPESPRHEPVWGTPPATAPVAAPAASPVPDGGTAGATVPRVATGPVPALAGSSVEPVTVLRARINRSTAPVSSRGPEGSAPQASAQGPDAKEVAGAAPQEEVKTVAEPPAKVYVDAEGKPVPPPPDPVEALTEIRKDISAAKYKEALGKITPLLSHPELTREQLEEVLHLNAEMLFMANQKDLGPQYDAIMSATISAMNYNQESPRNAAAYLRLGYLNLQVGNLVEADAYFTRLRRQYPLDENIPLTYYYWGEYYYGHNEKQLAADQFQYILSNYSGSNVARDAALGLARSFTALGYYREAFDIIEYIEKRWPRLYLQSPSVLEMMGDVAFRQGNFDFALDKYLLYYNLMPHGPNADVVLTRIGDTYAHKRMMGAAKMAYLEAERRFPNKDGGLVAMMRLAEVGINDTPEMDAMFSVFSGPFTLKPSDIYQKIITEHSESPLVPLAQLKLAMWYLWSKKYEESLDLLASLVKRFPDHELVPRAEEVALKAFSALVTEGASQNRASDAIMAWSKHPLIQKQEESLSAESRVALALSMWKQNNPEGALQVLAPLFRGRKDPAYGEQALLLALNMYHDNEQWQAVEAIAAQVELWEIEEKTKAQLEYLQALGRENSGKSAEAVPLWNHLTGQASLTDAQKAYVDYFLARDAEEGRRLQDAYLLGRSALSRFLQVAQDTPTLADNGKVDALLASLMDICETSGRLNEALDYATQYMTRLPEGDSRRQGMLFRIAGIYRKQGNTDDWRKTLAELVEKHPNSTFGRAAASTLRSTKLAEDASQFAPGGQL